MIKTYYLNGKEINRPSLVISLVVRIIAFVLAFVVLALSTPITATQAFGAAVAIVLFGVAKTTVVNVE